MPELIQIEFDADRERAIDVLLDAGEAYSRVPRRCFLVSDAAVRLLQATGIRFRVVGERPTEEEEENHGTSP